MTAGTIVMRPPRDRLNPLHHRTLIWNLAQRDLKARYKSTVLGWTWALLVPLAQIGVYTIVFSIIFRATPPDFGNGRTGIFPVWLFCALAPWHLFANAMSRGVASIVSSKSLFQKVYLPSYVPVLGSVTAIGVQAAIEFGVLLALLVALGNFSPVWLAAVPLMLLMVVFVAATTYTLAVAHVYFRDVGQILPVVVQLLFFMSAILYPLSMIPEEWNGLPIQDLMLLNPLLEYTNGFREIVYANALPSWQAWAAMTFWAVAALGFAAGVFRLWGRDVGELA